MIISCIRFTYTVCFFLRNLIVRHLKGSILYTICLRWFWAWSPSSFFQSYVVLQQFTSASSNTTYVRFTSTDRFFHDFWFYIRKTSVLTWYIFCDINFYFWNGIYRRRFLTRTVHYTCGGPPRFALINILFSTYCWILRFMSSHCLTLKQSNSKFTKIYRKQFGCYNTRTGAVEWSFIVRDSWKVSSKGSILDGDVFPDFCLASVNSSFSDS